ncbi:MAG: hypothetical protein ACO3AV_04045 [Ilumatobacteraceae bacterium]
MTALRNRRRRLTALMGSLSVIALVAVLGLLYVGAKGLSRYQGAQDTSMPTIRVPETPVGMMATVDLFDRLTSVTVFVLLPNGRPGGSIITVPVSADSGTGGIEKSIPLSEVYREEGAKALVNAVESALTISIDKAVVADVERAESLLAPLTSVVVSLPSEVFTTEGDEVVSLYPAGDIELEIPEVVEVLNAHVPDQLEADRLGVIEAVWQGVAEAAGEGDLEQPVPAPVTSLDAATGETVVVEPETPENVNKILRQLWGGPVEARGLPTLPVDEGTAAEGVDVVEVDTVEAVLVFATIAPSNMSAPQPGLSYRIVAPPGYDERVKFAVGAVLYLLGNVQSVYMEGPVQETTSMVLADPSYKESYVASSGMFGSPDFPEPDVLIEGVDVVIQLGLDFLEDTSAEGSTLVSTTTSTTLG